VKNEGSFLSSSYKSVVFDFLFPGCGGRGGSPWPWLGLLSSN